MFRAATGSPYLCCMAEVKTKPTIVPVPDFLAGVEPETRRTDALEVLRMMGEVTGVNPYMFGPSIIGFGSYHYQYASGHEGDAPMIGFSPRKDKLVFYLAQGYARYEGLMYRLGKHKLGKACLYINKLADVDTAVLRELMAGSWQHMKETQRCAACDRT